MEWLKSDIFLKPAMTRVSAVSFLLIEFLFTKKFYYFMNETILEMEIIVLYTFCYSFNNIRMLYFF